MKTSLFEMFVSLVVVAALPGCSAARDVAVSGTVRETSTPNPDGPIRLSFYESAGPADAGPAPELELLDSVSLPAPGAFRETVSMQGKKLYVVAFVDADGSDACTDGESWGETVVDVGSDDTANVVVKVTPQSHCLPMSTPE